ncbi:uncharacterized protein [Littorina saxatilis]|uniref:uncharacterized protein n=1 Tax=Littorina saxatilis TaxID=31220 RepID=UPI0038B5B924
MLTRTRSLADDNNGIVPLPAEQPCTARRKLDVMKDYVAAADETDSDKERCFIELKNLKSLFSAVACGECGGTLSVCFGDKMGYSREIRLACEDCTFTKQQHSCSRLDGSNNITMGFDVNNSIVMCFNELGCGEAAFRKFSAIMSIPGLSHNTYRRISKKVGGAHREVTANVLQAAVQAVHDANAHGDPDFDNGDNSDEDGDAECAANDGDSSDSANVDSDDDSSHSGSTASTARRDSDDEGEGRH